MVAAAEVLEAASEAAVVDSAALVVAHSVVAVPAEVGNMLMIELPT